ncbi:MAG: YfcE family phosphodiesterase [Abditibacteriaceae bacterium]
MKRIGVIADTHLKEHYPKNFIQPVLTAFDNVDLILHAGDVNAPWVIEELQKMAPVHKVLGNTDDPKILSDAPISRRVMVEDCVIGMAHGDTFREPRIKPVLSASGNMQTAANALSHFQEENDVNAIIFGHSHFPLLLEHEFAGRKVLLLNPGSVTQKRVAPNCGCAVIEVEGNNLNARLISW